jgi:hypothetical protein
VGESFHGTDNNNVREALVASEAVVAARSWGLHLDIADLEMAGMAVVLEVGMVVLEDTVAAVRDAAMDMADPDLVTDAEDDIAAVVVAKIVRFEVTVEDGYKAGRFHHSFEEEVGSEVPVR